MIETGATGMVAGREPMILTVEIEDYYQVAAFEGVIPRDHWYRFESRLQANTRRALDLLARSGITASFFVRGWIADAMPELIRDIADAGHEVASKGYLPVAASATTPAALADDIARAQEAIESATGQAVRGHRFIRQWRRPVPFWAREALAARGYAYDSSFLPVFAPGDLGPCGRFAHSHAIDGRDYWELPLPAVSLVGCLLPIAGGNHFRQFPHRVVKRVVDRWHRTRSSPFVMYFHVWELDPTQPQISSASRLTRLRHYRRLDRMEPILEDYFRTYRFGSAAQHLGLARTQPAVPLPARSRQGGVPVLHPRTAPRDAVAVAPAIEDDDPAGEPRAGRTGVTIVVPCFNEGPTIPYLANTLRSAEATLARSYDLHFVFVDDGSTDFTSDAIHKHFSGRPNVSVIRHQENRGVAGAILTGIRHAETEIVCSIDCDCTYDPHELATMVPLLTGDVDVVTASPYHPYGRVENVPAWRLGLSRGASFLYRRVLRQKLSTYTSCFRVYRRSAIGDLHTTERGFLGVAEMLGRLDLQGHRIAEYPTTLRVRVLGVSKMKTLRVIRGHLRLLGRLAAIRFARAVRSSFHRSVSGALPRQLA